MNQGHKEAINETPDLVIQGHCVILYGQEYTISIGHNTFKLCWHLIGGLSDTRKRATQGYLDTQKQAEALISRLQPTEIAPSDLRSWYATRLYTAKDFSIREVLADRVLIGRRAFGDVFKGIDSITGGAFAVKQVKIRQAGDVEKARKAIHCEIKTLEQLSHV